METKLWTLYSDVTAVPLRWLWYPYMALGKVTLLQGDPGGGKSTMMMNLIAEISKGGATPDGTAFGRPQRVIYQCSEDDGGDTIKARLESAGADCRKAVPYHRKYYEEKYQDDTDMELVDVYIDITGQKSIRNRKEMIRLISDCMTGRVNCISTQTRAYLAANNEEFFFLMHLLFGLDHPVEIVTEDTDYIFNTIVNADKQKETLIATAADYVKMDLDGYRTWVNKDIKCPDVIEKIYEFMGWERECKYKIRGQLKNSKEGLCLVFELDEFMMEEPNKEEYVDPETGEIRKIQVKYYPDYYKNRIGRSYNDYVQARQLSLFEDTEAYSSLQQIAEEDVAEPMTDAVIQAEENSKIAENTEEKTVPEGYGLPRLQEPASSGETTQYPGQQMNLQFEDTDSYERGQERLTPRGGIDGHEGFDA